MMMDYPQIVSQLNLLLGAGHEPARALGRRLWTTTRGESRQEGERPPYEEMAAAWNEMCGGVPEKDCYESFGGRCGLQAYMKLGALLSQNLRRGTKGLADAPAAGRHPRL